MFAIGVLFAAWQLISFFANYHRDRSAYEELASNAVVILEEEPESTDAPDRTTASTGGQITSEVPISVDWDYLRSINSSVVGWLYCPDTVVNYPVVQTQDQEFYLTHGFDGNDNTSGTLFVDANAALALHSNYIIYGHNMKDNSMFGTFKEYVNRSYFDAHPILYYLTPSGSYRIDLFCAHIVEGTYDNFPGYFSTDDDYRTYLNLIAGESFWVNYDAISTDHQLMTFSTCTSAAGYNDARFVVHGIMVPIQ